MKDDMSLKVRGGNVENSGHERDNPRNAISQMLCLERLHKDKAEKEKTDVETINSKKNYWS